MFCNNFFRRKLSTLCKSLEITYIINKSKNVKQDSKKYSSKLINFKNVLLIRGS